jgi:hypothetical protein
LDHPNIIQYLGYHETVHKLTVYVPSFFVRSVHSFNKLASSSTYLVARLGAACRSMAPSLSQTLSTSSDKFWMV